MASDMPSETPKLGRHVDAQLHAVAELAMTDGLEDRLTNGVFIGCTVWRWPNCGTPH